MALAEPVQAYIEEPLEDLPLDPETEAEIDTALERARLAPDQPSILEAVYHPGPVHSYLMVRLSDERRLLVPREDLPELANATDEQIADMRIPQPANTIWWPQLDDGLYLPEFLAHRWHTGKPESESPFVGAKAA